MKIKLGRQATNYKNNTTCENRNKDDISKLKHIVQANDIDDRDVFYFRDNVQVWLVLKSL